MKTHINRTSLSQRLNTTFVAIALLATLAVTLPAAHAQTRQPLPSLGTILNPDGTLNSKAGATGSFDPTGYRLVTSPNGQPRFITAQPLVAGDENWDDRFAINPIGGYIFAVAFSGTNLYVGGRFTWVGATLANNVARWDGVTWSGLNGGVDSTVYALATDASGNVYAGGYFGTAGSVGNINSIAKWDGANWSALGTGLNNGVFAIAVNGSNVYVGGDFTVAGTVSNANHIARWDGTTWSGLDGGVDNTIYALVVSGTNVYAGGDFTVAGTVSNANHIARWDGTNWNGLSNGVSGGVEALAVSGTNVFAGGVFTTASNASNVNNIARWDGTRWYSLSNGFDNTVFSLSVASNGDLYAAGYFITAGGTSANSVAHWDGTTWSALGLGLNNSVKAITVNGTNVIAAGFFTTAGGSNANFIAQWDSTTWSPLGAPSGNGVMNPVYAFALGPNGDLYVGGNFTVQVGTNTINYVARWDGLAWSPLGDGVDQTVLALAFIGTDLYVGGELTGAGVSNANHIAKWDGANWSTLGDGVDANVNALTSIGTDLYVGGDFTTAGGSNANHIAKWDGANWSALGSGMNSNVSALVGIGANLYVGGEFTTAGGSNANHIAKWDGANWNNLGTGTDGPVRALAAGATNLFASGAFTTAGGNTAINIALWNGAAWSAIGGGLGDEFSSVNALATSGNELYAAGDFSSSGNIAHWDGATWTALGSGLDGPALTLAVSGTNVFVAGDFTTAGGKPSNNFGIWHRAVALTSIIDVTGNLAFGSVIVGQTATQTMTIANSGSTNLTVTGIVYPTGFTGAWSGTLAVGGSTNVAVIFAPIATNSYGGTVTVNSDAASGTNTIAASGTGLPVPVTPTRIINVTGNLAFGGVIIGQTATQTMTIANSGNTNLTVTGITYPAGFSGAFSGTITAGGSTNVAVVFAPGTTNDFGGTVTVNSDATDGTNTLAASGTGLPVPLAPTITSATSLPDATVHAGYSTALLATGGTSPYSWSVVSGTLPAGLNLSSAGTLSGTPSAAATNLFRVRVTGANSLFAEANCSLVVLVNYGPVAGTFNGLALSTNVPANASSGSVKITVKTTGAFSATLTMGGVRSSFKGHFDVAGNATNTVGRKGLTPLQVVLHQDVSEHTDQIAGTVSSGGFMAELLADLAVYGSKNPCPLAGTYTVVLAPADDSNPAVPQGFGYGTLKIAASGKGKLAGALGDGTKLMVGSVPVSKFGTWPLYKALYKNLGSCVGWVSFETNHTQSATVDWFKLAVPRNTYYPAGFTTTLTLAGDVYVSPTAGGPSIAGRRVLTLGGDDLSSNITASVVLNSDGSVTVLSGSVVGLALKVNVGTGQVNGNFTHPANNKVTKFSGVLLQNDEFVGGTFLGTDAAGFVTIETPP